MLSFLRLHWPDIGILLAIMCATGLVLFGSVLSTLQIFLWLNFIALLLHEFEEYRFPGSFPRMINQVLFKSKKPDRYPLNTNTALWVNVFFGWTMYILAALFAEQALWLAIMSIMVNVGNIFVHVFVFNIRGKTWYNPGMATSLVLFLPLSLYFFWYVWTMHLMSNDELVLWIVVGFVIAMMLTLGSIAVMKDKKTAFIFPKQ